MATKRAERAKKKKAVRPSVRDDGTVTVTLTFPMPIAVRAATRIMENMTTPQALKFLNEIVKDKENRTAARKKRPPKGNPDPSAN